MRPQKSSRNVKLLPRKNFIKKMAVQRVSDNTAGLPLDKFLQLQQQLAGKDNVKVTPPKKGFTHE